MAGRGRRDQGGGTEGCCGVEPAGGGQEDWGHGGGGMVRNRAQVVRVCALTGLQGAIRVCGAGACEGICTGGGWADVGGQAGYFSDSRWGIGEQGTLFLFFVLLHVVGMTVAEKIEPASSSSPPIPASPALADELDYITVSAPDKADSPRLTRQVDKASRILGISHRRSMEPIPASNRTSILSTRSVPNTPTQHVPTLPLTSLYLVSGLPKSPHTWTLADPDSVLGLHHSEGAVARWWRPEVLGSTVSPGAGGGKKKKKNAKGEPAEVLKGAGALSKAEVGKMLSKALKVPLSLVPPHSLLTTLP